MALIKSISGIRGTIGGEAGTNLTPFDVVEMAAAYGQWLLNNKATPRVLVGRDGRVSGDLVSGLVVHTLRALGLDVLDLGLSTTPTVEMAVVAEKAGGGIIVTASHNPGNWNALKFLNAKGEFISAADGATILDLASASGIAFASADKLGRLEYREDGYIQAHIDKILALPFVDAPAVREKQFTVVVDAINSTGTLSVVPLLEQLGCTVILLNGEINGTFAHNPEPLPENLVELSKTVTARRAHLGVAVDPDVDRLALVCEDGEMFGEEYTLVAVADYILSRQKGPTVSNLSSTLALRDVTEKYGCSYHAAAVGEVNVVEKMKAVQAVIGGEGNGGVIYPALHYGRDALAGLALFLTHLALFGKSMSFLRKKYPDYTISKNKIQLAENVDLDRLFAILRSRYHMARINTEDGLKIEFESDWIHLRRSNTEPIVRIYAESHSAVIAGNLVEKIRRDITEIIKEMNL